MVRHHIIEVRNYAHYRIKGHVCCQRGNSIFPYRQRENEDAFRSFRYSFRITYDWMTKGPLFVGVPPSGLQSAILHANDFQNSFVDWVQNIS